jgi:hypothetical protein
MIDDTVKTHTEPEAEERGRKTGLVFPSLDELLSQLEHLAQAHPDQVAFFVYGTSHVGEPLYALRVGEGPRRVLAYAFPQPDEPLGGLVVLRLAQRLLEDEALCRGATWVLLPCVDPDGARRNEGWFTAPLDLAAYARRHYRPPEGEQVEWSFPSDDPAWPWDRPRPETRALQVLLDEVRPQVLFPLHNALVGGAYAFVSEGAESLAAGLPARWEAPGLPTHRGEPELPFTRVLAPGVFRLPTLAEMAAALSSQGIADPAGLLGCGAPAFLYARRYGEVLTVVLELPLFAVPGIDDTSPSVLPYGEVQRVALADGRAAFAVWSAFHRRAFPFLKEDNPYRTALAAHRSTTPYFFKATATWLESDAGLERLATVAEALDGLEVARYWRLLPLGLLRQALAAAGPEAASLGEEVAAQLEEGLAAVLPALPARPVLPQALLDIVVEAISEIGRSM